MLTDPTPQADQKTCPMCEFKGMPCPGGAHAYALYEDGIHSVEDYVRKCKPSEPSPAPPAQGPEMPRSRDNSPQPLDTKEKSMQDLYAQDADGFWIRREKPDYAERVIEVAPQAYSAWTPEKEQEMLEKAVRGVERMNPNDNEANMISAVLRETLPEVAPQGEIPDDLKTLYYTSKNNFGIVETSTVRLMTLIERIGRAESALTAMHEEAHTLYTQWQAMSLTVERMREERDRARDALRSINRLTSPGNRTLDDFMRDSGLACDIARAALKPVSERQPEGKTK